MRRRLRSLGALLPAAVRLVSFGALLALAAAVEVRNPEPASSSPDPVMRLEPATLKVTGGAGTPLSLDVVVDGVADLGAFEFEIEFDPGFLKLVGIRQGPFLGSTGRAVVCQERAVGSTREQFGCNTEGPTPPGPAGSGVVASIDFFVQGRSFGETLLLLQSCAAADVLGKAILKNVCESTQITINPPPPGIPRMLKLPVLQNLFLTRQGAKLPPATCLGGINTVLFEEWLSGPILEAPDPKDPFQHQQLGAFQFEVRFDPKLVCVRLQPGPAASGMACIVQDATTAPTLKGIAIIGCVTQGKSAFPDTTTDAGRHLADIIVRPQPEVYSQMRPNQENGIAVQILDQGCQLADLQGHAIALLSCEDAELTMRFLEGDTSGDCQVDITDTQDIAFRWGASVGNLLYQPFKDLVPSGQVKGDGKIDIQDLQFAYGRFGSTCGSPHPSQLPVNSKAGPTLPTTPALTPTPAPTGTPVPRINKSPNLLNLFLSSPPATQRCEDSADTATFDVVIKDPITSPDPKTPAQLQQLGAFEFETQFDPSRVCITIAPGQIALGNMTCLTKQGTGFVRFGCVTVSKANPPPQPPGILATITVRPQPALYPALPARQGKRIVTKLVNENCVLADLQGHAIESGGCGGATVIITHP